MMPCLGIPEIPEEAMHRLAGGRQARDESALGRLPGGRRIVIRPFLGPKEGLDVTETLIAAVARELDRRYGGNKTLNRLEAERLLLEAL